MHPELSLCRLSSSGSVQPPGHLNSTVLGGAGLFGCNKRLVCGLGSVDKLCGGLGGLLLGVFCLQSVLSDAPFCLPFVWVGIALGSCQQRPRGCWMCWRWLEVPACGARWGRSAAPAAPLPARTGSQEAPAPGPRKGRQGEHGRGTGLAEAASLLRLATQHSQAHTFAGASKQLLVPATLPVCNDSGMLSQHLLCHPKLALPDFQKQRSSLLRSPRRRGDPLLLGHCPELPMLPLAGPSGPCRRRTGAARDAAPGSTPQSQRSWGSVMEKRQVTRMPDQNIQFTKKENYHADARSQHYTPSQPAQWCCRPPGRPAHSGTRCGPLPGCSWAALGP